MTNFIDALRRLRDSLAGLGMRRLIALGLTGMTVFLLVGVTGYLLSRPQQEILYSGLDSQDVTRIGAALDDSGISFDVNAAGDAVLVAFGQAAKARMLLAQKGLPRSDTAGYELFDKLGSLGLTTFMQQVTKIRALEGELAKTIRLIDGIRAARVHLAMRSEGSFREPGDQASASVIIRSDGDSGERSVNAIRHLVAAAIPGLSPEQVTVMSADGRLLASMEDSASAAPEKLVDLERRVSEDIEAKISRTLLPYVGFENLRVSVTTKLNADHHQINETTYDPNSRVERSVRTVKESGEAQNASSSAGVTVEQNIPVEEAKNPAGDKSNEKKDRKEELTNFEISSRSVSTTSDGYGIDRLSIAVVVNRTSLLKELGDQASSDAVSAKVNELQKLIVAASGFSESRGDAISVTAVDFVPADAGTTADAGEGVGTWFLSHLPSLINAAALIIVTLLILFLGLRPALRVIVRDPPAVDATASMAVLPDLSSGVAGMPVGDMSTSQSALDGFALQQLNGSETDPLLDSLAREVANSPQDRLSKIVELDPDRAVEVLKQWLRDSPEKVA